MDGFYEEEGDDLVLKDKISKEDREELNDIFGKPMVIVSTLTSDSEESKAALAKMGIPEGTDPLAALSQMPAEALAAVKEQVGEKIDKMRNPSSHRQVFPMFVQNMKPWVKMWMPYRWIT